MSGKRYPVWFDDVVSTALLASAVLALNFGVAGSLASDLSEGLRLLFYAAVAALVALLLAAILLVSDVSSRRDVKENKMSAADERKKAEGNDATHV
jgi:hypothetical protein